MTFEPALFVFVFIAVLLTVAMVVYMFRGMFRQDASTAASHEAVNIEIARDELAQLKDAKKSGFLNDDEYKQAARDVELSLAETLSTVSDRDSGEVGAKIKGRWLGLFLAPLLLILTLYLYLSVGEPRSLQRDFIARMSPQGAATVAQSGEDEKLPSIQELLPRLEAHLETVPEDVQGWKLLGTTYLRMRRFKDADKALSRALELEPEEVSTMLQAADARSMISDGVIGNDALALIDRALEIEPDNVQANWLKGMANQQTGDPAGAVGYWERILPVLKDDPVSTQRLQQMIAEAKQLSGNQAKQGSSAETGADSSAAPATATAATEGKPQGDAESAAQPSISIDVSVDPALLENVPPETPVFIFARAVSGPPMPLAVAQLKVADLPTEVTLDDSMAMIPTLKLSTFPTVTVGARVALSGNPIAQPGDLYTEIESVAVQPKLSLELRIDSIF